MSTVSPIFLALLLLVISTLTVQSVTRVFTYDDGQGSDEHCCLVRIRDQFCVATPVTRSLLQVNKQCPALDGGKPRRAKKNKNKNKKNRLYVDRISRRLNVESVREQVDHILVELDKPLDSAILERDLVCLASNKNHLNLDRCVVELVNPLESDHMDDKTALRKYKHRRQHRSKGAVEVPSNTTNTSENEVSRIEVGRSVQIREGEGLVIRQSYRLNPSEIRPVTRAERQCWSWFRRQSVKIQKNPSKTCLRLNDHRDRCIHQLIQQKSEQSFTVGSRLFCENRGHQKLIGHLRRSNVCFQENNQIIIEHLFNDIANLSDMKKNKEILQFISEERKLKGEYEDDCQDQTSLVEINDPKVESRARNTGKKVSSKAQP